MTTGNIKNDVQKFHSYFANLAKLVPPSYKPKFTDSDDKSGTNEAKSDRSVKSAKSPTGKKRKQPVQLKTTKKKRIKPNENLKHNGIEKKISNTNQTKVENCKTTAHIKNDGKMVFSKFDFGEVNHAKAKKKKKSSTNNLEISIKKAVILKEKMDNLQDTDPDKAKQVAEKDTWTKAVSKAAGVKVKDDIKLLNKSLKKKQDKKARSSKKWKERHEKVEDKMNKKQTARSKNIKKKNQSKGKFVKRRVQGF